MAQKHTLEELNNCSREELITIVLMMQGQLDTLNDNIEKLIEQVRIANYRFGKHTETLKLIEGQLSFFDEAEAACDEPFGEPSAEEVLPAKHRAKKKGQRDLDLKDFPEESLCAPTGKLPGYTRHQFSHSGSTTILLNRLS